ncbi:MAG TPA: DUF1232 domain-containing protein [Candidatus Tumulicola sp.]
MKLFALIARSHRLLARVWPLMRHNRVPLGLKTATIFAALLIVSPLDIFSDIPVLGLLDDAMLLVLLASIFVFAANRLLARAEFATVTSTRVSKPLTMLSR